MAERSTLTQVVQIGVEATPGTSVAANKRLTSLGIEPSPHSEIDGFRPAGQKFRALHSLGKEWSESALTGRSVYTELIYPLSSVLTTGVITTPAGGALSRKWVFTPAVSAVDTPKTFTVEHGSSVRADKFSYGIVTELGMTFNRTACELSGSMLGRALQDNIVLTASPTVLPLVPVLPTQISVYADSDSAGLGGTKLTRVISAEVSIGSRYNPVWVLDAANPSYVSHVEVEPDVTMTLTLQADSNGMDILNDMRNGATKFMRIEAIGANIDTNGTGGATADVPYQLDIDMACQVSDTGGFSDQDGVYAVEWTLTSVADPTWAKALEVSVVTNNTAL